MTEKVCIYHGNCADGFTAAWVIRKAFTDDNLKFYPGFYGAPAPDVTNKEVIITDFSYPRAILEGMAEKASSVLVLDHHETAEQDLKDAKGVVSVFDMHRSGCRITWDYYFPNQTPPQLLLHIEDRDLWRFALRKTREIQASVFSFEYKFDVWDWLMKADLNDLARDGEAIERKHFKDIRELIPVTKRRMLIGGYDVPVANLPYTLVSDAANIMAQGEPFAACYYDTEKERIFGLRSTQEGINVAEIAKMYGGGGHKHASGFRVPHGDKLAK